MTFSKKLPVLRKFSSKKSHYNVPFANHIKKRHKFFIKITGIDEFYRNIGKYRNTDHVGYRRRDDWILCEKTDIEGIYCSFRGK